MELLTFTNKINTFDIFRNLYIEQHECSIDTSSPLPVVNLVELSKTLLYISTMFAIQSRPGRNDTS